jgi:integrase/recombinase XerD
MQQAPAMERWLTIFRRHSRTCPHRDKGRDWRKCSCPIHLEGYLGDQYVRESLAIRSWDVAQARVREREANALFPEEQKPAPIGIKEATEKFFKDAHGRHLAEATISKYDVLLNKQLLPFAEGKGFRFLCELDVESMREFRTTWKDNALSGYKKGERLRSFFHFCVGAKYISENPVNRMRPPKVPPTKIKTFSSEEMEKIMWASDLYDKRGVYGEGNRNRVKAFVLVLRYTGLRIRDVVTLERNRIDKDGKLYFYTAKTGTPVFLPLPKIALDALKDVPNLGPFYFWTGNGLPKSAVADWQRSLRKLFALAGLKGNPHMFRHSLATELLTKGVSLETVAAILGNTPAIVQKHYSHFVKSWQLKLEEDVRKIWV